ncbi:MAG: FkbM family methyltransferase [Phenylobacterium sp.]|uniref:FkbM family methyltransferase n=1 Tax=Phenylobacterium sp. TaxID=1871053 RepID=UPI003918FDC8
MRNPLPFITNHPLNAGRPVSAILRFAAWQASSRIFGERTVRWIDGARLVVRNGMTGATGNIYCGLHEFADMGFVLHALRPADRFLDVGANVGSYTVLASAVCGARTLAFEPDPGAAAALRRNVAVNGIEARVAVHETAVGEAAGWVWFTVGRDTTNQVAADGSNGARRAPTIDLDSVPDAVGAAVVKLDVEGYEASALAGAGNVLADPALLAVLSECQDRPVTDILARHGFERAFYDPFTRTLSDAPLHQRDGSLFVRDAAALRERLAQAPKRKVLGRWL